MKEIRENKVFRSLLGVLMMLAIIFLLGEIDYLVKPLLQIISIILLPILIGGYLYYLFRPMVQFLTKWLQSKGVSILLTVLVMIALLVGITYFGGNVVKEEAERMIKELSHYLPAETSTEDIIQINEGNLSFLEDLNLKNRLVSLAENVMNTIRRNVWGFFSSVTNIGTILLLIPLVLFFLLKDDELFYKRFMQMVPEAKKEKMVRTLQKIDETLVQYIGGQVIVALILGGLTLVGYLIIGLRSAIILALIAMVLTFIPFIGPILGALPAIFIGLSEGVWMVAKILVVITIVQQLEGNLIRPLVQGDRLHIHPLLVIFLVLIFVILFGFLGALFAVPCYAVLRVFLQEYLDGT